MNTSSSLPVKAIGLVVAVVLGLFTAPAGARAAEDFAGATVMSLDELDEVRGGLQTPTGVEFGFGAVVRTFVDGSLALQTRLTWTDSGPVEALEFGAPTADLVAKAASSGVVLQGDGELQGLLIPGDGGATAVAHSVSGAYIGQLVINNANNRDIRQSTEITLALPEFAQMQQAITMQTMDLRLQTALGAALRDAIAR